MAHTPPARPAASFDTPEERELVAAYIADMSKELSRMAMTQNLTLAASLLSLAAVEARRISEPAGALMSIVS